MNVNQPIPPNFNLPEPIDMPATPVQQNVSTNAAAASGAENPQAAATPPRGQYGDTLGQEWIHAVEAAIRQGIDDPRALSMHIDELRAQYISGRYTKEVKRQAGKEQ